MTNRAIAVAAGAVAGAQPVSFATFDVPESLLFHPAGAKFFLSPLDDDERDVGLLKTLVNLAKIFDLHDGVVLPDRRVDSSLPQVLQDFPVSAEGVWLGGRDGEALEPGRAVRRRPLAVLRDHQTPGSVSGEAWWWWEGVEEERVLEAERRALLSTSTADGNDARLARATRAAQRVMFMR